MRDVAAHAQVSLKTVSRVINRTPTVAPQIATRVQAAIRELDYRPNVAAARLRRADRNTRTIGLLLEDVANPFSSALHRAVEDQAKRRGWLILAASSDEDEDRERDALEAFLTHDVDGLVVVPAGGDHGDLLAKRGGRARPVVFVDRPAPFLDADTVTADNRAGARAAVRHLAAHGHRRIALLGDGRRIWTARERHIGYLEGLAEAGIAEDPLLVRQDFPSIESAEGAALDLLASEDAPTALFTAQNLITTGALRALRARGLQNRIAIVGFDDLELAEMVEPPLSVIAQDARMLGRLAAGLLFDRLDGDDSPPRHLVVPTRLLARGSGELRPA